jgi:hypothetical protein
MELSPEEKYVAAFKKVKARKSFYINLINYVIVNLLLALINYINFSGNWWFYWVSIGWGIGIIFHAFSVFGMGGYFGDDWEKRKIKEIMEKENQK